MDTSVEKLKKPMGTKWDIFNKIHNSFISFAKDVKFRIFPIYIVYSRGEKVFAVIYFKGRLVDDNNLIIGLGLSATPKLKIFTEASRIRYSGINYCINLKDTDKFDNDLISAIRMSL